MIKLSVSAFVAFSLISAPLVAAEDVKFNPIGQRDATARTGFGAQASVRIKLGGKQQVRGSERVALGIAAGPAVSLQRNGVTRTRVSPALGLTFKPGYETSFSLAGQRLATTYTKAGYAQAQRDGKLPKGRRNGVSTAGWIGIGVGAVAAILLITFLTCTNEPTTGADCGIAGD